MHLCVRYSESPLYSKFNDQLDKPYLAYDNMYNVCRLSCKKQITSSSTNGPSLIEIEEIIDKFHLRTT